MRDSRDRRYNKPSGNELRRSENWHGPGIYEHYKGGLYIAFGLGKSEADERLHVAYMALSASHQQDDWYKGMFCIFRPLNIEDGKDAWNTLVVGVTKVPFTMERVPPLQVPADDHPGLVPRFKRVS